MNENRERNGGCHQVRRDVDIWKFVSNPTSFKKLIEGLKRLTVVKYGAPSDKNYTHIAGIDAGGMVFASILAMEWGLTFVPVRKVSQTCVTDDFDHNLVVYSEANRPKLELMTWHSIQ